MRGNKFQNKNSQNSDPESYHTCAGTTITKRRSRAPEELMPSTTKNLMFLLSLEVVLGLSGILVANYWGKF